MKSRIWIAIAVLIVAALACGGPSEPEEEVPAQPPTEEEAPPTEEESPEVPSIELDEDAMAGLNSYRGRMVSEWTPDGGTPEIFVMEQEATRDPAAQRMSMESDEGEIIEFVQIGDTSWACFDGECMQTQQSGEELAETFGEFMLFDPAGIISDSDFDDAGRETVNDIRARHYILRPDVADAAVFGLADVTDVQAEAWIADEAGLPAFVVRYEMSWTGKQEDQTGTFEYSYEVYDVNAPITVEPPEGAAGFPEDVPEYTNAADLFIMEGMISFSTPDDVATVADFYRAGLPAEGWTVESDDDLTGMIMQSWRKGERSLNLMISSGEEGTSVVISIE